MRSSRYSGCSRTSRRPVRGQRRISSNCACMSLTLNGYSIFPSPQLKHHQRKQALAICPTLGLPIQQFSNHFATEESIVRSQQSLSKEVEPGTRLEPRSKRNREPLLAMLVELLR